MASASKQSQPVEESVRVLICASPPPRFAGLERLLHTQPGLQVVGSVLSVSDLQTALVDADPDVVIVCIEPRSPHIDWERITGLAVPIVWLAEENDIENAASAISAGVQGVLVGSVTGRQLAGAVSSAASGLTTLSSDLADLVRHGLLADSHEEQRYDAGSIPEDDGYPEHLTKREREVLEMMADGLSNKEIAAQLNVSAHTVKFHVSSILGKLGASSRTEAASIGLRRGLITI